jgi:hypothetical protein
MAFMTTRFLALSDGTDMPTLCILCGISPEHKSSILACRVKTMPLIENELYTINSYLILLYLRDDRKVNYSH